MHHQLRGGMIKLVCCNCFQKTYFISDCCEVRHVFTYPCATLAVLSKFRLRPQHLWYTPNNCKAFPVKQRLRAVLSIHFHQFGFVIKQLQLRWCTRHMEIYYAFRTTWEMWRFWQERMCGIKYNTIC